MEEKNSGEERNVFQELKELREQKGYSLEEVSRALKINIKYIRAMEEGDLDQIPQVYDKLFFQAYVRFLQPENEQEYFEAFRAFRHQQRIIPTTTIEKIRTIKEDARRVKMIRVLYFVIPLIILGAFILILALNSTQVASVGKEDVTELTVDTIIKDLEKKQRQMVADSLRTTVDTTKSPQVAVTLKAVDKTWLRAIADKADTTEYLLNAGNRVNLQADSTLRLLVGNAAGVDFTVNGQPVGILGKPNQVITNMLINQDGIVTKRIKNVRSKHAVQADSSRQTPISN